MKKRNLIFPLVVSSSLFIPSVEPLERTADFNSLENENNIYEAVDILIAEGNKGGGGQKPSDKEAIQKKRQAAQDAARKRIEAAKPKEITDDLSNISEKIDIGEIIESFKDNVININAKLGSDVIKKIEDIPELLIENETAPYILSPFFRCGALTEKAIEAEEDDNQKRADTYAELAIKSVIREKDILEKQGRQIKEKSIDPKLLANIENSLLGINSIIRDDYKSGNRYMKKALESENQDTSNLKTLIAYTGIISGEMNQGCSDLEDLIINGTIDLVDLDIIRIEDICRSFPEG